MRWFAGRSFAFTTAAVCALAGSAAFGARVPSATVTWHQISTGTSLGIASAGLLRTGDGRLHVVWARNDTNSESLHYSTLGAGAKMLSTGTVLGHWNSVTSYPRLVPRPNGGIRLVFTGANGQTGSKYNEGEIYSATAGQAGQTWSLTNGTLSQSKIVPLTDDAAATQSNGTPVAGWSTGGAATLSYHVGIDSQFPAAAPDHSVSAGAGGVVVGPTMARDSSGAIWGAWFNASGAASQGYWVDKIVPSAAKVKAPGSGSGTLSENEPFEAVAFTSRVGGGEYLAYCVPTKLIRCAHIDLWKAGATKALVVPGSATGHASNVAIAAAPNGYLWVAWYDSSVNKIKVVRTTASAGGFGTVRSIAAPSGSSLLFDDLQAEASKGPVDLVALSGVSATYWAAEVS